jgi:hypothetical protein
MDKLNLQKMKEQADLRKILRNGFLANELDLERALIFDRKLRLSIKERPELAEDRKKLRMIIKSYEEAKWNSDSIISDIQLKESDDADFIAEQERKFLNNRKFIIKNSLASFNMTQQDLGMLLGHGKSYMSELLNGISPFTNRDLIIIHRILKIELKDLIPTIISQKDTVRLKESISRLNKPKLRFEKEDVV